MKLSISKEGLKFLEEERKYDEIRKTGSDFQTNSSVSDSRRSSQNTLKIDLPNLDAKRRVSRAFVSAIKQLNSPKSILGSVKSNKKMSGFNYYTSPSYFQKRVGFISERLNTEPAQTGNYDIFKDSLNSISARNKFLKNKVNKIITTAKKKQKLTEIEKKIKGRKFTEIDTTRKNTKPNCSLPFLKTQINEREDDIIDFNKSIDFFNKTQQKERIDYKEFHQEIREIERLKKLQTRHKISNKVYKNRMKQIKKNLDKIIFERNNSHAGFNLTKQLRRADKEFNQVFNRKKHRGEDSTKVQVFMVGDISGGPSENYQLSIGNVKFDKYDKEKVKGLVKKLPDVLRDEKRQNIRISDQKISQKEIPLDNRESKSNQIKVDSANKEKLGKKLRHLMSVGAFDKDYQ